MIDVQTVDIDPPTDSSIHPPSGKRGWTLKEKKLEYAILVFGALITLTGLILQFRANRLGAEANELARQSNKLTEDSYKLQLWDDCHDRQVTYQIVLLGNLWAYS